MEQLGGYTVHFLLGKQDLDDEIASLGKKSQGHHLKQ